MSDRSDGREGGILDILVTKRAIKVKLLTILLPAIALLASSCGGGAEIVIRDLSFEPAELTIKAGDSVTWKNEDRRSHQIMSGAPPVMTEDFVSPLLQSGDTWSHTFEDPGEYPYHSMTGGLIGWVYVE